VIAVLLSIAGCGSSGSSATATAPVAKPARAPTRAAPATARKAAGHGHLHLVRIGTFDSPTNIAAAPGDVQRVFVVEKSGAVVVVVNGHKRARPFLNISRLVKSSGNEQGLLSIVFAPDYQSTGRLYVDYTDRHNNVNVVQYRRSGTNPDLASAGSARTVIRIDHHRFRNHNGGQLQFGPDGDLYIGVGDGGSEGDPFNEGQNTDTLLGKVLRIAPQPNGGYAIPNGNPFAGRKGRRAEIWAYGLRNPWRFSFDLQTGALIIGDVGQDQQEEIDFARAGTGAGANYGWSIFEGDRREKSGSAPRAIFPVLVARHSRGYCAIIGGYVVRDQALGGLYGRYLYGDNCKSQISSVKLSQGHAGGNRATGLSVNALSSFGQDTSGRIYLVSLAGPVYRLAG
jgi:glucose/arabinose dehydrogenase